MILPKLVEEVNTGKNFAQTRQVYQSVILAAWYKKALKDSLLGRIYADKSKVEGVESDVKDIKEKVYDQYLEAFKKGAYNFIREESNGTDDPIPRKYFSGGLLLGLQMSAFSSLLKIDYNPDHAYSAASALAGTGQMVIEQVNMNEPEQFAASSSVSANSSAASSGVGATDASNAGQVLLGQMDAARFKGKMREGFRNGTIKWTSQFPAWQALETDKPKIHNSGVFFITEKDGKLYVKLGQRKIQDQNGFYSVPVGKVDHSKSLNFENEDQLTELRQRGLTADEDLTEARESVPAAAVRKLLEETRISIELKDIDGRVDDFRGNHDGILNSFFVVIGTGGEEFLETQDLENYQDVPLELLINSSEEDVGAKVEEYLRRQVPQSSLMPGLKREGMKNLRQLILKAISPFESLSASSSLTGKAGQMIVAAAIAAGSLAGQPVISQAAPKPVTATAVAVKKNQQIEKFVNETWKEVLNTLEQEPIEESQRQRMIAEAKKIDPEFAKLLADLIKVDMSYLADEKTLLELSKRGGELNRTLFIPNGFYMEFAPSIDPYGRYLIRSGVYKVVWHAPISIAGHNIEVVFGDTVYASGLWGGAMAFTSNDKKYIVIDREKINNKVAEYEAVQKGGSFFAVGENRTNDRLRELDNLLREQFTGKSREQIIFDVIESVLIHELGHAIGTEYEYALSKTFGLPQSLFDRLSPNFKYRIKEEMKAYAIQVVYSRRGEWYALFSVFNNSRGAGPNSEKIASENILPQLSDDKIFEKKNVDNVPAFLSRMASQNQSPDIKRTIRMGAFAFLRSIFENPNRQKIAWEWFNQAYPGLADKLKGLKDEVPEFLKKVPPQVMQAPPKKVSSNSNASEAVASSTVGGIDFDPSKLNLQIKRDGRGVPLPLPQQNLENIDIKGLYPVIINILPINAQTLPILGQLNVPPDVALSKS